LVCIASYLYGVEGVAKKSQKTKKFSMKKYCIFFKELEISKQLRRYLNEELFQGMGEYREKSYCNTATLRLEVTTLSQMYDDAGSAIDLKKLGDLRVELHKLTISLTKQKIEIILL
jgi:hypothetical protein